MTRRTGILRCPGLWPLFAVLVCTVPVARDQPARQGWYEVLERYDVPEAYDAQTVILSDEGDHVAVVLNFKRIEAAGTMSAPQKKIVGVASVMLDHEVMPLRFFDIDQPVFSGDGRRVAYPFTVIQDNKPVQGLAVNGRIVTEAAKGYISTPVFHRDGTRVACIRSARSFDSIRSMGSFGGDLLLDGQPCLTGATFTNEPYLKEGLLRKTAGVLFDGKGRLVASVGLGGRWFLTVDGKKASDGYEDMGLPVIYPDDTIAYAAKPKGEWFVMSGGVQVAGPYEDVGLLAVSADGKRLAFPARIKGVWCAVIAGEKTTTGSTFVHQVVFSPDSRKIAFVRGFGKMITLGERHFAVSLDDALVAEFKVRYTIVAFSSLVVSRDGTKVAYLANGVLNVNDKPLGPARDVKMRADGKLVIAVFDDTRKEVVRGLVDSDKSSWLASEGDGRLAAGHQVRESSHRVEP